jgi:hypothetical protein
MDFLAGLPKSEVLELIMVVSDLLPSKGKDNKIGENTLLWPFPWIRAATQWIYHWHFIDQLSNQLKKRQVIMYDKNSGVETVN